MKTCNVYIHWIWFASGKEKLGLNSDVEVEIVFPVIDNERPWGHQCKDCGGKCSGHYVTKIYVLLQLHQSAKTIRALPPSVIIEDAYKKKRNRPPSLQLLASKCCLSNEQVRMWWDHLQQNALNRARGVEKAKATRQRKKQEKKNGTMSV